MFTNAFLTAYTASYLVLGISALFWSIFVFLSPPRDAVKRTFSWYSFVVCWWAFFSVLMINSPNELWGTFWDRICLIGVVFIPSTFIHFVLVFLGTDKKYKLFVYGNYLVSFLFLAANFTPYFVATTSPKFGLNFYTDPGLLYFPFIIYFFVISFIGILSFYLGYIKSSGNRRRQLFNLFWSSLIGHSLGGFNYNLSFGFGPPFLAIIGNCAIILYIAVYAYTITKHRLMDVSVVISRTVAEVLTFLFYASIYLFFVWIYVNSGDRSIDIFFLGGSIAYGLLVGHYYLKTRLFLQTTSDKLFLHGKYDYYKELSEASAKVGEKLSLASILSILYKTFYKVVEISNSRVFLPENFTQPEKASRRYVVYDRKTFQPQLEGEEIKFDDPLVSKLISSREPILFPQDSNRELIIPCLLEDRLIAILVLGRKLSEDHYTDEDIGLLEVLANQVAMALDHTRSYEKIKSDLEVAEIQLARSERLASLGTLTAGVTHEIRNPLTVIRSETERLANEERDLNYLKEYRELLLKHIDRIAGIVQRMLSMAKEKPRQEKEVDINEVIDLSLQLLTLGQIKIIKRFNKVPHIKGDPEEMEEVFVNLIHNSIHAMPENGTLTIKTYLEGGRTVAEVSDTGKGIPPENTEKIFDPFFSTRHEGVGLGLSIVYRIVREHGGDIKVTSEVGKGTTFKVIF